MQQSIEKIHEDALNAIKQAQNQTCLVEATLADGSLEKAIQFVKQGQTPEDPVMYQVVEKSMVAFMLHMGEDAVPQWTIPPGDTSLNSKFKETFKRARKRALDQIQKDVSRKRSREDS